MNAQPGAGSRGARGGGRPSARARHGGDGSGVSLQTWWQRAALQPEARLSPRETAPQRTHNSAGASACTPDAATLTGLQGGAAEGALGDPGSLPGLWRSLAEDGPPRGRGIEQHSSEAVCECECE